MDKKKKIRPKTLAKLYNCDVEKYLKSKKCAKSFDLIVTSPPYNIGKEYEERKDINDYIEWQTRIIDLLIPKLSKSGSICWQVGNHVQKGSIIPLDLLLHEAFSKNNLKLRNRIIWTYGHGFHAKKRFSGRYEATSKRTMGKEAEKKN